MFISKNLLCPLKSTPYEEENVSIRSKIIGRKMAEEMARG